MQTEITEIVLSDYVVLRMQAGEPAAVAANRTTKMSAQATAERLAEMHPKREYVVAKVLSLVRALSTEAQGLIDRPLLMVIKIPLGDKIRTQRK